MQFVVFFCKFLPLLERPSYFSKQDIDLNKLFCETTDGAAAMIGKKKGFVKLLENHVGRKLLSFQCIIHQQSLCAKASTLTLVSVMKTVVEIINFVVSQSSLVHRQFKCLEAIEVFLDEKQKPFLHWKAFTMKLDIFTRDINIKAFKYFPNVKNHANQFEVNIDELQEYLEALKAEFDKRSQDFYIHGSLFSYLIQPDMLDLTNDQLELFSWMDIDDFEMQQVEFRSSEIWTSKFAELRKSMEDENLEKSGTILNCWSSLPSSFICLKKIVCFFFTFYKLSY